MWQFFIFPEPEAELANYGQESANQGRCPKGSKLPTMIVILKAGIDTFRFERAKAIDRTEFFQRV